MNAFEKHGLEHVSASQINRMSSSFSAWFAEKVLGYKFPSSAAMWRGIAVEDAVAGYLGRGQDYDDALAAALAKFDEFAPADDPKFKSERDSIKPMADLAIDALTELGKPDFPEEGGQHMVKLNCRLADDSIIPVIGFVDFVYPATKKIIDLKTTHRMPSEMSRAHQRQRAIYARAYPDYEVSFLYVTTKKSDWKMDGDVDECLDEIKAILNRTNRFLSLSGDTKALADCIPIDPDDWAWRGSEKVRAELFGL